MEQNGQHDENEKPKNESKLPQLPPVLLQKIALMLNNCGLYVQFRDRIRFASVSRRMNVAVRSSIDRMQRRRIDVTHCDVPYLQFNDISANHQPTSGYTQTECIDALLAFGRPNEIEIKIIGPNFLRDDLQIVERILASLPPNSIHRLDLDVSYGEFGAGTPFYRMLTSIGKMVNLELLKITCFFDGNRVSAVAHTNSSPSVPPGSPFLQLLKLEKLTALHVDAYQFLTEAQKADLINLSSSNISHICVSDCTNFSQLMMSLNDRSCANITNVCCLHGDDLLRLSDQLQLLVERLPQCTSFSASVYRPFFDRRKIDQIGRRLLESAIAHGHKKVMTVCLVVPSLFIPKYLSAGGQTEFTYERKSTIVQVLIVSDDPRHCLLQ